ncbi:MAG TPA: hypothetical protein VEB21_04525, partial [Terriglobales bacterium]|nr:hypothetical protein [Terriglobales bacterium]
VDGIPTETSREANARVRVADGETVVLGGIYADRQDDADTGVPYLRDLPVLGSLFRRVDRASRREDLLVFLTPHVIDPGQRSSSPQSPSEVGELADAALQPVP